MDTLIGWALGLTVLAAWFTHVFHCFQEEAWGLLIGGAIFFPVAIVNGVYIWFT